MVLCAKGKGAMISTRGLCGVQADVLVCAKGGGGLLKERMALVADLWAAGLRAEMMQQAAPSLTAQYEYAHARHIPWLLIIHAATLSAADTVKVALCLSDPHNHSLPPHHLTLIQKRPRLLYGNEHMPALQCGHAAVMCSV